MCFPQCPVVQGFCLWLSRVETGCFGRRGYDCAVGPQAFCVPLPPELGLAGPSQALWAGMSLRPCGIELILCTHTYSDREIGRDTGLLSLLMSCSGLGLDLHNVRQDLAHAVRHKTGFNGLCLHAADCNTGNFAFCLSDCKGIKAFFAELWHHK